MGVTTDSKGLRHEKPNRRVAGQFETGRFRTATLMLMRVLAATLRNRRSVVDLHQLPPVAAKLVKAGLRLDGVVITQAQED